MPLPDEIREEFEYVSEHFQQLKQDAEARGDMSLELVQGMSEVLTTLHQWNEESIYGFLSVRRATKDVIEALIKGMQGL